MTNPSWGIKRNCPNCSSHFYDLNKNPAVCPKCKKEFDPALQVKAKRKVAKRGASEEAKDAVTSSFLGNKKAVLPKKKDKKETGDPDEGGPDIAEIEDVDDIENLQELSELEEMEESTGNGDDADDESIIEDMDAGDKSLVENVEDEEAKALVEEIGDDDEESASGKKAKAKKKSK